MLPGGDPVCAPQAAGKAEANHLQPSQRKWSYEPKDLGENLKSHLESKNCGSGGENHRQMVGGETKQMNAPSL